MAGRGFDRSVSVARAEGFAWENIVEHVPGFKTAYGAEAAEKLFESMSVFGSSFSERRGSVALRLTPTVWWSIVERLAAIPLTPSLVIEKVRASGQECRRLHRRT